ncbi:hypothetical protein [Aquamicrobium soli]|uniref:Uncharacterized protein n=1 Tax=Aquamicrobium soli TaxID=1811518 RepID=A0ABV7K504_9HYPH
MMSKLDLRKELDAFKKQYGDVPADSAPTNVHLWQVTDREIVRIGENAGVAGIDMISIPAGKFLTEGVDSARRIPSERWVRMFAHLTELPEQFPPVPVLCDAPLPPKANAITNTPKEGGADAPSAPVHADAAHKRASGTPSARTRLPADIDRGAVLIDLAEHRKKPQPRRESATEIMERLLGQMKPSPNTAKPMALAPTQGRNSDA